MKNKVKLTMFLFFGLAFLVYIFPFAFVEAAKLESGVTINAPPPTTGTCPDANNDGNNDNTGAPCGSTTAPTAGTCGLQIISGVPINYGQLNVGQASSEQKVTYKNVGTATAQVMVKASDWIGGTPDNPITMQGAGHTRVATTPGMEFAKKVPLEPDDKILGELSAGQTGESFWSMYVQAGMSGSPHQDVTLNLIC